MKSRMLSNMEKNGLKFDIVVSTLRTRDVELNQERKEKEIIRITVQMDES